MVLTLELTVPKDAQLEEVCLVAMAVADNGDLMVSPYGLCQ